MNRRRRTKRRVVKMTPASLGFILAMLVLEWILGLFGGLVGLIFGFFRYGTFDGIIISGLGGYISLPILVGVIVNVFIPIECPACGEKKFKIFPFLFFTHSRCGHCGFSKTEAGMD